MPDYMTPAFAEHEARYQMAVMAQTWGHLDARPGTTYRGFIVYAVTAWAQVEPIQAVFLHKGREAEGPGFFNHMCGFIDDDGRQREVGVYRYNGTYRVKRNGEAVWKGATTVVATYTSPML